MKRFIIVFSILALFAGILSCDSSSDKTAPATTLTAKVTYTASAGKAPAPGSGKIYLYLYKSAPVDATATADYDAVTSVSVSSGTEYTLSIPNLDAGDYYAMAVYDYADNGSSIAGEYDAYALYNGVPVPGLSDTVTVASGVTTNLNMSIDDTWQFTTGGAFVSATTGRIQVKTKYTGTRTAETGNDNIGKIHVYLYSTWPPANAQVIPAYSGKSDTIVADSTTQYTINVANIAPGNYHVVVFYDFKIHSSNLAGNTDRYILFNADDTTYHTGNITSEADAVSVVAGETDSLSLDFYDDTIYFGSSGSFQIVLNEE